MSDDVELNIDPDDDHDEQNEPTFSDWLERGAFAVGTRSGRDAAEMFASQYTRPDDLLLPGTDEDLAVVREISPQTADALEKFRDDAKAEEQARAAEAAKNHREVTKEALKKKLPEARAAFLATARDVPREKELLAEIAAEQRAAAGPEADSIDVQHLRTIEEAAGVVREWKRGKIDIETAHEAAQRGIAASAALEAGSAPIHLDADEFYASLEEEGSS